MPEASMMNIVSKAGRVYRIFVAASILLAGSAFAQSGPLQLQIVHMVGDRPLVLNTATYTNAIGQAYTITNFKYYISHLQLTNAAGKVYTIDNYYLVDEEESDSKTIDITGIPVDTYTSVSFTLGVDSARNCSGAQSGTLDPVHGMFWTWNTGYIFLKLEGKAPAANTPGHMYEYHIGGYQAPAHCSRTITLQPKQPIVLTAQKGSATTIYVTADAAKVLAGNTTIDFAKTPAITDFHGAEAVADNYAQMFVITNSSGK